MDSTEPSALSTVHEHVGSGVLMNETYPYSVQRTDVSGVPHWAVWKNDDYALVTPLRTSMEEAETDLMKILEEPT